jgi:hypothetical protein
MNPSRVTVFDGHSFIQTYSVGESRGDRRPCLPGYQIWSCVVRSRAVIDTNIFHLVPKTGTKLGLVWGASVICQGVSALRGCYPGTLASGCRWLPLERETQIDISCVPLFLFAG